MRKEWTEEEIKSELKSRTFGEDELSKAKVTKERMNYYTLNEVAEICDRPVPTWAAHDASSQTSSDDWAGGSFKQAKDAIVYGYKEGQEGIRKFEKEISAGVKKFETDLIDDTYHDTDGALVDVPMFLDGEPECMIQVTQWPEQPNIIKIFLPASTPWTVSSEQLRRRGAAVAAMVDSLERKKIRCEVFSIEMCDSSSWGDAPPFIHCVKIKDPGEPLSIDRLAGTVAEPWWLRRVLFRLLEENETLYKENSSGYGRCIMNEREERLRAASNMDCQPHDIYIPEKMSNFETDEKAVNFVIDQLNLHIELFKKGHHVVGAEMRE